MNSGRGRHSHFFVKNLGLALAPTMCPDLLKTLKEVKNKEAFIVARKKNDTFFSWANRFQVFEGMFVQSSKISKN